MMRRTNVFVQRHVCLAVVFFMGLSAVTPAGGGITVSGDLTPAYIGADPWTIIDGDLKVGDTADGTLEITLGSSVSDFNGWIAYTSGTVADVNIIGTDSRWANSSNVYVGFQGDGALLVADGGAVTSVNGYLGRAATGVGEVVVTGVASSWLNSAYLYVGYDGDANMVVSDGGTVTDYYGSIGDQAGSYGQVTVTGEGSTWSNTDYLMVGNYGDAELTIAAGGQVTSYDGALGFMPGSTGSVVVTDANSAWTIDEDLTVGLWGQGELEITNGGQVTNEDGYIGGYNSWMLGDEVDTVGYDPNGIGQVLVSGAGSQWNNTDTLYVGYAGDANMVIADGGQVSDGYGMMSNDEGSQADVTVSGPNSVWVNTEGLGVGIYGNADLLVEDGGRVTSLESGIAMGPNSVGTVEVTGAGSLWSNTEELGVGIMGSGTLTIAHGGQVTNTDTYIGGLDADAPNVDASFLLGDTLNGTGIVEVTGAGSRWDSDGFLYVGYTGTGTLEVNDGGLVTSEYGAVAADPNSTGTVTITDADSKWSVAEGLAIGAYGQGDLTVSAGGFVGAKDMYIGGFDTAVIGGDANDIPQGTGTVTVTGVGSEIDADRSFSVGYTGAGEVNITDGGRVTNYTAYVGFEADANGVVTVSDDGSTWQTASIFVANHGQAQVLVEDGGLLNSSSGSLAWIGNGSFGTGVVTVRDPNSRWISQGSIYVGGGGDGTLNVSNGAQVTSTSGSLGFQSTGVGRVNVTDADSQWTTGLLTVGNSGEGTLAISAGGTVEAGNTYVGNSATGVAHVTVSGDGSLWAMDEAYLGTWGQADLTISAGGQVTDANAYVGMYEGSTGAVTVTGANSTWVSSGTLRVGQAGDANMVVSDGGTVEATDGFIGYAAGSTGQVTVTGADSLWQMDDLNVGYVGAGSLVISSGGAVDVNEIILGNHNVGTLLISDGGTLDANSVWIGQAKGLAVGTATVTGTGSLWTVDAGLYIGGTAAQAGGTGVLDVNDGGVVTADEVRIWENGTLSGDGTLTASMVLNSGTIAPGNSIGTLTIDGDLTMDPNSTFEVEVDNSGNSDKLVVTGDADIQGGTVKAIATETLRGTLEYTILDANSVTGTFDTLNTALLSVNVQSAELGYDADAVKLEVTALGFDDLDLVTKNQRAMGAALQTIAVGGGNAVTTVLQSVETDQGLRSGYEQLSGHTRPSLAPVTAAGATRFMGAVSRRLRRPGIAGLPTSGLLAMGGPDAGASTRSYDRNVNGTDFAMGNGTPVLNDRPWGVWGRGYGLFGDTDGDPEAPGYNYTTYGAAFGLDFQFTETLLLGVTTGYSDGDVDYDDSRNNSDLAATYFGLYGTWTTPGWYVDGLLAYSDLEHETRRYVDVMSERLDGELDGHAVSGYFETGFDWRRWSGWLLQPLAGLQFTYLHFDEYTETGGSSALGYDEQSYESYKSSLGMKFTKELLDDVTDGRVTMQVRARWQHEFGDTESIVDTYFASDPTTVFAVRDDDVDRDSAVLGVGLGAELGRRLRLHADYDVRANADETAHLVSAGLVYRW